MKLNRRSFLGASLLARVAAAAGEELLRSASAGANDTGPLPGIDPGGLIRPPGARPEAEFRARCVSCGVCGSVCRARKFDAISVAAGEGGEGVADFGTPAIRDMRDYPCTLCMECPRRCPSGALRPVAKEEVRMGMALIDLGLCFGWNGDVCLSCSKACPMGAKIFDFNYAQWGNQPTINERCVGCGLCVKYCPLGGSAIKVVTRARYRQLKPAYQSEIEKLMAMPLEERYRLVYERNMPRILERGRLVEREYR